MRFLTSPLSAKRLLCACVLAALIPAASQAGEKDGKDKPKKGKHKVIHAVRDTGNAGSNWVGDKLRPLFKKKKETKKD